MLKTILSFIWDRTGWDDLSNLSLDINEQDPPPEETQSEESKEEVAVDNTFTCRKKTGTITAVENDHFIINDTFYLKRDATLPPLKVGATVMFTTYLSDDEVQVTNLEAIDPVWHTGEGEEAKTWCYRTVISQVIKREGRKLFLNPADLVLDLNTISSEFIPIVGDWLDVEVKAELNEDVADLSGSILEIVKIHPLRPRVVSGKITKWDKRAQTGLISGGIYFTRDVLESGFLPVIGDKVVGEAVESAQDNCLYRAIKVVPCENIRKSDQNVISANFDVENENVTISDDINLTSKKLDITLSFTFIVTNISSEEIILSGVDFVSKISQCVLDDPERFANCVLKPLDDVFVTGSCTTKNMGTSRDLLLFEFDTFKIGRWITINIDVPNKIQYSQFKTHYKNQSVDKSKYQLDTARATIPGLRPNQRPRFRGPSLPAFRVPEKLYNFMVDCVGANTAVVEQQLYKLKPCLNLTLSFQIYEDFFHTLLFFAEIHQMFAIRDYDQDRTCFVKNGEYLMLEIENLAERRPSLMIGDRLICRDPNSQVSKDLEGFIHKISSNFVYAKFAPSVHQNYNGEDYSIRMEASRTVFRRAHQAVYLSIHKLGHAILFPSKVVEMEPQLDFWYDSYDDTLSSCHEKVLDRESVSEKKLNRNQKILNALKAHSLTSKPKLEWFDKSLNYYQKEAVRNVLMGKARPLPYLLFGPPGTGKTVTLVEIILQIVRLIPHCRILVCAPSNSAADILALRLIATGVLKPGDLVRLVAFRCITDNLISPKLAPYCAVADISRDGTSKNGATVLENGMTLGCNSDALGRHRITVATCVASGILMEMSFPKGHFTHIMIDEAGQSMEPQSLIPLVLMDSTSGQAVLAGDPLQLGAVVQSAYAKSFGLGESLLERFLKRFPYMRDQEGFPETGGYDPRLVTRLVYNYRNLPEILSLSSNLFYDGEVKATLSPEDSVEAKILYKLKEILPKRESGGPPAFVFHGVNGQDMRGTDSPSWMNPAEASQVFYYVNEMYRLGMKAEDIGIITPYIKQTKQIRLVLDAAEFEMPKIGTVEEFQGQEFKVVLLSTVRSNEKYLQHDTKFGMGFVACAKRLNVAITRAEALLVVIGNPHLLSKDLHWRSVIKYCVQNNAYCGCELPLF